MRKTLALLLISVGNFALSACGGGGGGSAALSTPPPPPPPPSAAVTIFQNPSPGEYVSMGASISGPGGNLDTYSTPTAFGAVSTLDADQVQVRYNSGGYYEIKMPAADWDRLVHYKGLSNPTSANNYFQPEGVAQNLGYLVTSASRNSGYQYSELAGWGSAAASRWGFVAFGVPTASGNVPVTGSASYNGVIAGSADVMIPDLLYGGYVTSPISGTVALNFDFGSGTLGGSMTAMMDTTNLGTFTFRDTVFSVGSTAYSGAFDTSVAGQNFFLGQFTGPNAAETVGAWALPFVFGGQDHQAFGAWIGKKCC
jgi:hypothetical protein